MSDDFDLNFREDPFSPKLPDQRDKLPSVAKKENLALAAEAVPDDKRVEIPDINMPGKTLTEEQKALVKDAVKDVVLYGSAASAMVCKGTDCPYAPKCPLLRNRIPVPVGQECPIELAAMQAWSEMYFREMGINPHNIDNAYDTVSASMMSGLMLQMNRAKWGEAMNPILEQTLQSTGPGGVLNIIKVGNFNTDYKEKAMKAITKLAKDNVQTRERKIALTKSGYKDKSKHAAAVNDRMAEIRQEISTSDDDATMKELTIIKKYEFVKKDEPQKLDLVQTEDGDWETEDQED